jgi:hypothetical protein
MVVINSFAGTKVPEMLYSQDYAKSICPKVCENYGGWATGKWYKGYPSYGEKGYCECNN